MRKKIVASYILLIIILTLTFSLIMMRSFNNMMTLQIQERFLNEGLLVKTLFQKTYEARGTEPFDFMGFVAEVHDETRTRITIIDEAGVVLADTHENPAKMNNHLNREEVLNAVSTGMPSTSVRYSNTVKADFMYVAVPVKIEDERFIVRVSKQLVEIQLVNTQIINASVFSMISAAIIAVVLSLYVSKKITKPIDTLTVAANEIADGDFGRKIYITAQDQIGELAKAFNKMSTNLNTSMNELKHRNVELEAILNSIINGIIAVDQNKNIIMINKFCFEILGLPIDYVIQNESMYKIVRNDEVAKMVEDSMVSGMSQVREMPYVHIDKILRIYVNPIITMEREIIGSIIVIQDVTQVRKLEQMRSDFVSNVSHELKTPLTSIRGFVDTLKNGAINQPETARRFLDIIDIESDRLYRLINDILLLSEIESMDREPESQAVDLQSVVEEVFDILDQKASDKKLKLNTTFEQRFTIMANRDRIKQMFINLVDNAIKYTERGEVSVNVSSYGSWIRIHVRDTGIGFAEIHKDRLFERFYRADKGRSRSQGGTGLGLSIVKHIVLLYRGKISVESAPGEGTTFEILLPKQS